MGEVIRVTFVFAAMLGLYLFLAGTVDAVEIGAASIAASAGLIFTIALTTVAKRRFRVAPSLRAVLKPLPGVLPECWVVSRELFAAAVFGSARQRGGFVSQPFNCGGNDPTSAGRRALTIIGVSLAPQTYVVCEKQNVFLLHALPAKPASADKDWPA